MSKKKILEAEVKLLRLKLAESNKRLKKQQRESAKIIKKQQQKIDEKSKLAEIDDLTEIENRRCFTERINETLSNMQADGYWYVLIIDLDGFKLINDTYGHPAGDAVLRQVSRALKEALRSGDLVARYGGDEFAILMRIEDQDVESLIKRIKNVILNTVVRYNSEELQVGASIGTARFSKGVSMDETLKLADQTMYDDKKS